MPQHNQPKAGYTISTLPLTLAQSMQIIHHVYTTSTTHTHVRDYSTKKELMWLILSTVARTCYGCGDSCPCSITMPGPRRALWCTI